MNRQGPSRRRLPSKAPKDFEWIIEAVREGKTLQWWAPGLTRREAQETADLWLRQGTHCRVKARRVQS